MGGWHYGPPVRGYAEGARRHWCPYTRGDGRFSQDCNLLLFTFTTLPLDESTIPETLVNGTPFAMYASYPGIGRIPVAQLTQRDAMDAVAPGGDLERLWAEAFVTFVYQRWENFIRPAIGGALGVNKDYVVCPLLGELRHYRNWIEHPCENTEKDFFEKATTLPTLLDLQPGRLAIDKERCYILKLYLNSLEIIVNPNGAEPAIERAPITEEMKRQIAEHLGPDQGFIPISTPRATFGGRPNSPEG